MTEVPSAFWETLRREIRDLEEAGARGRRAQLARLVTAFAPGRERYLASPGALSAYLRAFLPQEIYKAAHVLDQSRFDVGPGSLRVADLGAGPGSASLGALIWLHSRAPDCPVELHLCDREERVLAIARRLAGSLAGNLGIRTSIHAHAGLLPPVSDIDLILLQNVLSEVSSNAREAASVLRSCLGLLRPDGRLTVIEPADRAHSRALLASRDLVLAGEGFKVLAPCTRQGPCPALAREGDWCAMELPLALPREARLGLREANLPRRSLKWSYVVLGHGKAEEDPSLQRVVSDLRPMKGAWEAFLCGTAGRLRTRLLRRHLSEKNRGFKRLRRGDLVSLDLPSEPGAFVDLGPDSLVTPGIQRDLSRLPR